MINSTTLSDFKIGEDILNIDNEAAGLQRKIKKF